MSTDEQDPMLNRAIAELRRLEPVNRDAVRRVVDAAAAARLSPADEPVFVKTTNGRAIRLWSALGIAAAAAFVGFIARGAWSTAPARQVTAAPTATAPQPAAIRNAATSTSESSPMLQQFVFDNAHVRRVSVIGDFNEWNPTKAPMTRTADGASWSVIIPIVPGRHVYGFMVDDSVFTLDPRAPKVRDADLGTEGSVVIVGRP